VSPAPGSRRGAGSWSYERLEFLGDRVLGLIVAEMLLEQFPREAEGALARRFTELVRRETLAAIAAELGLGNAVRLPAIEEKAARSNPALLADACEAVLGALYLDGGIEVARGLVQRHWRPRMLAEAAPPKDPKTALQEWAQRRSLPLPQYRLVRTEGKPHQPVFTVAAELAGHEAAEASGSSKRLAEAAAAALMLERVTAAEEVLR
jgi:ribonuclease-3